MLLHKITLVSNLDTIILLCLKEIINCPCYFDVFQINNLGIFKLANYNTVQIYNSTILFSLFLNWGSFGSWKTKAYLHISYTYKFLHLLNDFRQQQKSPCLVSYRSFDFRWLLIGSNISTFQPLASYWLISLEWRGEPTNERLPHCDYEKRSRWLREHLHRLHPPFSFSIIVSFGPVRVSCSFGVSIAETTEDGAATANIYDPNSVRVIKWRTSILCHVEADRSSGSRRVLPGQWCPGVHGWRFRNQDWKPRSYPGGVFCPLVSHFRFYRGRVSIALG